MYDFPEYHCPDCPECGARTVLECDVCDEDRYTGEHDCAAQSEYRCATYGCDWWAPQSAYFPSPVK